MKKTLFVLSIAALVFASCDKNGENGKLKPLDATLEFEVPSVELVYGEPATISAVAVTEATLDKVVLKAVKKSGEAYEAVGEEQPAGSTELEIKAEFFADSKEMTDIELTLVAGKQSKSFYLPASVTGEPQGTAWINDAVTLYPDNKVAHNVNDNVTYPV